MEVYFSSNSTQLNGRAAHQIGKHLCLFNGGVFKTTDKERVVDILASEIYRRGEVTLVTDYDLVDGYLSGDEPDYFSLEILNGISEEGIRELAKIYQTKENTRPMIIKAELNGREIVDAAVNVMVTYKNTGQKTTTSKIDYVKAAVEAGKLVKAGVWYKAVEGTFKTKNIDEAYEYLKEQA
jgi:single-stranded DNA-specific DHH superfamily exonuclease